MLEARLKSAEDGEEEKRKLQQAALAKYRQAFTDDAEVCHNQLLSGQDGTACTLKHKHLTFAWCVPAKMLSL